MRVSATIFYFVALSVSGCTAGLAASDPYAFLKGSQWYVPTQTLPAVSVDPSTSVVTPLIDQTVWRITSYQSGYFTGVSTAFFQYAIIGGAYGPASCTHMVGSVTPTGDILISFLNPSDPTAAADATVGSGKLVKLPNGAWRFTMQMATGSKAAIAHWSYMDQCKAGEACVAKLPGVSNSLASFEALCAS